MAMSLLLVSSVYAMELSIEYDNDNQKSFKAQLMAGKIDECFKHIEGQKEKNRHYWTLAHEALFCINRPESSLNILKRIDSLLHNSPNSCRLIHLAAQYNDVELLKYLKENHTAVDLKDRADATPLFYAAHGNALDTMKLLKDCGANINAKNRFDGTPFLHAVEKNAIEAMELLKEWGADINAKTHLGKTPLHYAAQANAIAAMKLLKHWSADISAKKHLGKTPLHYAIDAMKLLKEWGDDMNAKDNGEKTPFHSAAEGNAIEAMKLLKDWGADISAKTHLEETPLHSAAKANAIEAMKLLKHWGADISAKTHHLGETPLHSAAKANAIEAMKLLKDWGADINAKDNGEKTPLHFSAAENAIEAMKLLKDWGADCNANEYRETPLHYYDNAIETLTLLQNFGSGITPLHCAAQENAIEAIKLLKDWGANIDAKEYQGYTALANAFRFNKKEGMDFLCFLGANSDLVNETLVNIAAKDRKENFKFILTINQMDPHQSLDAKEGMNLLNKAVKKGLFCSVRKLLNSGKINDINQKNDVGYTILHKAAQENVPYVVKILLTTSEIDPYSRSYGTMENCPACKAQTPYDKILKTHPGWGCQTCGSLTPYDLATEEVKELYDEMRERIAIICCLKKLPLPKELAYILFRLSNYAAKHTHLPKGLFHKALKVQEEKQNGGEEHHLKFEAEKAEIACEQKEAQAMMAAVLGNLELLKQLVSLGADLLAQDSCGDNALHHAVLHDRVDVAQYIMQCEPCTAIAKNMDGLNPIDLAIQLKKSNKLLQALYEETKKVTMSNQQKTNKNT